jgi:hypothetical protein
MADDHAPGRPSRPDEDPPRRRGGRFAWLVGTVPGIVAVAFVVIAVVVVLVVILSQL